MKPRVSLIKGNDRYVNVSQALAQISDDVIFEGVQRVVIKPNLVSLRQLSATHIDALRAVLDFVRERYTGSVVIAEGAALDNTFDSFAHFGFETLRDRYGIEFVDLNADDVVPVQVYNRRLQPTTLHLARTVVESDLRISVGPPKTHDSAIVTCSIKNMVMGTLVNRIVAARSNGSEEDDGKPKRSILLLLDKLVPHWLRYSDLAQVVMAAMANNAGSDKFAMHQGYPIINLNLANLAPWVWPHLAVVDGFLAMEGRGPTTGDPVDWRVALAGTDALAVDALTASLMGFDPQQIGYLSYCHQMGLGEGDVSAIETVGNVAPEAVRRTFKPHPAFRRQEHWRLNNAEQTLGKAPRVPEVET
jgi:uncharacterized protein (DUF362 family)